MKLFFMVFSFILLNNFVVAQYITTKNSNKVDTYTLSISRASQAFINGNYKLAEELYSFSKNLINSKNKVEIENNINLCKTLQKLQWQALTEYSKGNDKKASEIFTQILVFNPKDKEVKRIKGSIQLNEENNLPITILKKIKEIEKFPKSNQIIFLKKLYKENPLPVILSTLNKLEASNYIDINITKKSIDAVPYDFFTEYYTKGINNLKSCNYDESRKYFIKAFKLKPNAPKTKRFYYALEVLVSKRKLLTELLINPRNNFTYIIDSYEQIIKINRELEIIQPGSSCKVTVNEYANYLKNQLPLSTDDYNCDKIIKIANRIEGLNPKIFNENSIQSLLKSCSEKNNYCKFLLAGFSQKINSFQNTSNFGNPKETLKIVDLIIKEMDSLKVNCDQQEYNIILSKANKLKSNIEFLVLNSQCEDLQKKRFESALDLSEINQLENALLQLEKIDTTCIDKFFLNSLKREKKNLEISQYLHLMKSFEDSATISLKNKNYIQARTLFNRALTFSKTKSDSSRIEKGFLLSDCLAKNRNPNKCIIIGPIKCDTNSFNSIGLNFGLIGASLQNRLFSPTLFVENKSIQAKAYSQFLIGLTYSKTNYSKLVDHGISLSYFSSQTFDFYNQNQTILYSFQNKSIALGYEQKYHKKNVCLNNIRVFGKAGFLFNYNIIEYDDTQRSTTYDYIGSNFKNSLGISVLPSLGFEIPNKRVSFEVFAYRMALIRTTNGILKYPWNSSFVNGGVGFKFSYGFKI